MSDETKTYPGSSQVRRLVRGDAVTPEPPDWKKDPRTLMANGKPVDFYPIGALAIALNRSVPTIRRWEDKGWIPEATYRTSGLKQDRLYTEHQIKGLVILAREAGLLDPEKRKPVGSTDFPERAAALFKRLAEGA